MDEISNSLMDLMSFLSNPRKAKKTKKKIKIIFETDYWKLGRVKYKDMYKNITENYDI